MVAAAYAQSGYAVLPFDDRVAAWAKAAHRAALSVCATPGDMRHGGTWRVGLDELPNEPDGSVDGIPLAGRWLDMITPPASWHQAQVSVVYPGYPQQDATETDAAHAFRINRDAAHVDGLLPEGPEKRRHLREPHSFIVGLPLNAATASPLVVWPGSHILIRAAFAAAYDGVPADDWGDVDVTEIYKTVRRRVFETCPRCEVAAGPGQAVLVHRHLLHGVAPWRDGAAPPEGRMIAYFRPLMATADDWLNN